MFNKIALSWQMQYEMRWCIKQHSHLFYCTWMEWRGNIWCHHIFWTPSCTHRAVRGAGRQVPASVADRKGKHLGEYVQVSFLWLSHEEQIELQHWSCCATGVATFKVVLCRGPRERRGMLPENELLQPTLTISMPILPSGFKWLINIKK